MNNKKYIIGIDVGGTKIAAGVTTMTGKLLQEVFLPTPRNSAEAIYQSIRTCINDFLAVYPIDDVAGIGLGLPGIVDIKKGIILNAPNLKIWNGFPIVKRLKKDIPLPSIIDNDANAAALAESIFGAGKRYRNFIYITVSTGIGGGIILDKKLYYGSHLTAGEVGHAIIEATHGVRLKNMGKLETLASGTGLAAKAKELFDTASPLARICNNDPEQITAARIYQAAKKNDRIAQALITEQGMHLAAGIVSLVNILDPEAIIIGGGVAHNGRPFFDAIKKGLTHFELMTPNKKIMLLPAKLKKHVGLFGAAALIMQKK